MRSARRSIVAIWPASPTSGCSSTISTSRSSGAGFQGRSADRRRDARAARSRGQPEPRTSTRTRRRELKEAVANIANTLELYGARVLKVVSRPKPKGLHLEAENRTLRSAPFSPSPASSWRSFLNGGIELPMLLPRMGLDGYLPTRRITFGKKALEFRGPNAADTRFGAMVSIREYPAWSGPGMLDGLLRIQGEFIVSQSFAIADRGPVLTDVARVERQIAASDEKGTEVETAIATARNELVTGRTVLGKHHLTVMASGRSLDAMERCVQDVTAAMQNLGVTVVREDMNAEPAFWAQMPGNFGYIARKATDFLAQFRRLRLAA